MNRMLQIHFSNRVEVLYQQLKTKLFSKDKSPFTKRMIIVPSPAMKSWLMLQLAKDKDVGIAAGLHFAYLESGIDQLKLVLSPETYKKKPGLLEIALKIEAEIWAIIRSTEADSELWAPLLKYLHVKEQSISRKSEKRLVSLASKLATLFDRYETYGQPMLQRWESRENGRDGGWQGELWRMLKLENSEEDLFQKKDLQVDLFSISFLPRKHHVFLKKVSESYPVNYHILSPCQAFWTDILTDKESRRLKKYWEVKGGSDPQLIALEELLFDKNALLANFGRMGREMADLLEDTHEDTEEEYQISSRVKGHTQYAEFLFENVGFKQQSNPLTLLECTQADLLFLRNPEIQEQIELPLDESIQIHVVSSKMREVQVLYDSLMKIMERHSGEPEPVCPGDIIVMAPDITEYEPYIHSVFDGKIDLQIMDLRLLTQHPLVRGFLHLLSVPFTRWDVNSILQLLEFGAFRKKQAMTPDESGLIKSWVKEAEIRWGGDRVHREELLKQNHCNQGMVEESAIGTWEHGLDRLLYGWIMNLTESDETNAQMEVIPVDSVDLTRGELLGRWVALFKSMRKDLKPLIDGTRMTVKEWSTLLKRLLETYFLSENAEDEISKNHLLNTLSSFERILDNPTCYSFTTIKYHLEASLNNQRVCYREPHLQAVRFCSLLPMRALPAKVIVLLGMEEGAFPRKDQTHSLNSMAKESDTDYSPSQTDFDRYLFLEILLSVRQYLLISYMGYSKSDSKEKPSSLLITELVNYLDTAFKIEGQKPSISCVIKHPFREYDKRYFDGTLKSYSQENYLAAKAYYHNEKKKNHRFIPQFNLITKSVTEKEITLDLKSLISIAKNPVEAYYNRTLGIYLEREDDIRLKTEEKFVLSPLERGLLRKSSLKASFKHVIDLAHKEGKLPLGTFRNLAVSTLEREVIELKTNLKEIGILSEDIFEIEFSDATREPLQIENRVLRLPPLQVNYKDNIKIKIIGKLPEVVSNGLLGYVSDDKTDIIKIWPQYLVYLCLCEQYRLPLGRSLHLAKSGKTKQPFFESASEKLEEYLEYYFNSIESVSPLIPEWIPDFIKLDSDGFEKKVKMQLSERSKHFYNEYMRSMMKDSDFKTTLELYEKWKFVATKMYGEMYEKWY
jgi:exodeoxyribonuclease V gamma subunit